MSTTKKTAAYIEQRVETLKELGHRIDIKFVGRPAQPIIVNEKGKHLSEAMKPQEMDIWLDGFEAGHDCEKKDEGK